MNRLILLLALLFGSLEARAASQAYGLVASIRIDANGKGMVFFDRATVGIPPPCAVSAYARAFAFDTNTVGGRAILEALQAARTRFSLVEAQGAGTCTVYNGYVEDVVFIMAH